MTIDEIISDTLEREGWPRVTKHTWDRGGYSKGPITLSTLVQWRGRPCSLYELRKLTEREAREILQRRYIFDPRFHLVADTRLQVFLIDYGIHSGPGRAIEDLQRALGVDFDGRLGPVTLRALTGADIGSVYREVYLERWSLLEGLVFNDDLFVDWLRRHPEAAAHAWRSTSRQLQRDLPAYNGDESIRSAYRDRWRIFENQVRNDPPLVEWLATDDAEAAQMHNWRGWMNRLRAFLP